MSLLINFKKLIHSDFSHLTFLAHTTLLPDQKDEDLFDHMELTYQKYLFLKEQKGLELVIDSFANAFGERLTPYLRKIFENAIPLHDIGKINPNFQLKKMSNQAFKEFQHHCKSNHSLVSSAIYIDYFSNDFKNNIEYKTLKKDEKYVYYMFLYSFAYQISKHHGYLDSFEKFIETLTRQFNEDIECNKYFLAYAYRARLKEVFCNFTEDGVLELNNMEGILRKSSSLEFSFSTQLTKLFYVINKLLFSLIIAADHLATSEYYGVSYKKVDFKFITNIDRLISHFEKKQTEFFQNKLSPINILRRRIFEEAEENLVNNLNKRIFYLEAPTGSGKTNTSINLALKLIKGCESINKIFFVFPFNTLIEQTKGSLERLFSEVDLEITVVNSVTAFQKDYDEDLAGDEKINYDKTYLDRRLYNYEIVLTSHVALFSILFGRSKEDNYPLWQLANSVLILDEIQCYRNDRWKHIIQMLSQYAEVLNIKIIIMSATLPQLDKLLPDIDSYSVRLISEPQGYFSNSIFKNRVHLDYSFLNLKTKIEFEDLYQKLNQELCVRGNKAKVLFEFIKKDTAREFFNFINNNVPESFIVRELTGDDNAYLRKQVIEEIITTDRIIIVATQVIEAGLDIDADIGFKNISILDSEEQFLGRINRSCLRSNSVAYFFYYDDAKDVYKKDTRIGLDLRDIQYQKCLLDKDFNAYYTDVFQRIDRHTDKPDKNNFLGFTSKLRSLDFSFINSEMTLIEQKNYQLFFPFMISINGYELDGKKVWQEYKRINSFISRFGSGEDSMTFSEKAVKLSEIQEQMQYFTYKIIAYGGDSPSYYTDQCGSYFYIKDWEDFINISEGYKFNRKKYQEFKNSIFL